MPHFFLLKDLRIFRPRIYTTSPPLPSVPLTPFTSQTPIKMSKTFSLEDVAEHNSGNSLWIVVHNKGKLMTVVFAPHADLLGI